MKKAEKTPFPAKTARPCDSCLRRRARWYCAADDAFLCQLCDSSVHSANPLAQRHERVRLKTSLFGDEEPTWHHGCKRKARSPRGAGRGVKANGDECGELKLDPMVPDTETVVSVEEFTEEQLLYRVPIFDPVLSEFCSPPVSEDDEKPPVVRNFQNNVEKFQTEIDITEFEMDMESLLGQGIEEDAFCTELFGTCEDSGGGEPLLAVKEEEEVDDAEGLKMINVSFDSGSEEDEKVAVVGAGGDVKKRRIMLSLDYEAVISAWSAQGSPWADGARPKLNPDDCWLNFTYQDASWGQKAGGGEGQMGAFGDGGMRRIGHLAIPNSGREARVSRYREKRRTRLFAKKIRYEVRKLNAEKRPRMKGRFVKRSSFSNSGAATAAITQPQFAF